MKLSVVIPVFNEHKTLEQIVQRVQDVVPSWLRSVCEIETLLSFLLIGQRCVQNVG